ncbi:MAG: DMT family transporter [Thermoplasmata archaeon]|nr:DMT family transporter [Thermoplasmata archaeon]
MKLNIHPFWMAVTAAVLIGSLNLFSKNLLEAGFTPLDVSICREGVTAAVFFVILLLTDRSAFRIRLRDLWIFVLFALFNVLSNFFLFNAQDLIPLGTAAVLELTNPYFIMIFAFFLFGDKVTKRKLLAAVIEFLGCIFIIGVLEDPGSISVMGVIFGLLSGVTLAAFTLGSRCVEKLNYSENTTMFYFFFLSSVLLVPFADFGHLSGILSDNVDLWAYMLMMGVLGTLIPNYLVIIAVRRMDPAVLTMIITSSIVLSTVYGVVFFGDKLDLMIIIGIVMVLVALVILDPPRLVLEWWDRKFGKSSDDEG